MEKQETALEFYRNGLHTLNKKGKLKPEEEQQLFDQAKEMERAQRREDTNHGYAQGYDDGANRKEPARPSLSDHPPLKSRQDGRQDH